MAKIIITEDTEKLIHESREFCKLNGDKVLHVYHILYCILQGEFGLSEILGETFSRKLLPHLVELRDSMPVMTAVENDVMHNSVQELFVLAQSFNRHHYPKQNIPIRPIHLFTGYAQKLVYSGIISDVDLVAMTQTIRHLLVKTSSNENTVSISFTDDMAQKEPEISFIRAYPSYSHGERDVTCFGRTQEVFQILQTLSREDRKSVLVVGDNGIGKSNLLHYTASLIKNGDCPQVLKNYVLYKINTLSFLSNCSLRSQAESKLEKLAEFVSNSDKNVIIVIDDIHSILANFSDLTQTLKLYIDEGRLQLLMSCPRNEYKKYIEKDQPFDNKLYKVTLEELSDDTTANILRSHIKDFESIYHIAIPDNSINDIIKLTQTITHLKNPKKSFELLEESAAFLRNKLNGHVYEEFHTKSELDENIKSLVYLKEADSTEFSSIKSKIRKLKNKGLSLKNNKKMLQKEIEELKLKIQNESDEENKKLLMKKHNSYVEKMRNLALLTSEIINSVYQKYFRSVSNTLFTKPIQDITSDLNNSVVGQDEAIKEITASLTRIKNGIQNKNKPLGNFLFMGPSGVGKTELAKSIANSLNKNLIHLDLSEYNDKSSITRLIGANPGYVGYDEGGQLTEKVRAQPDSVVLLDEIDKAHETIYNALLQILDEGRITDGKGRTVSFNNCLIIMTSNYSVTKSLYRVKEHFAKRKILEEQLLGEIRPEIINRIESIVPFHNLSDNHLKEITVRSICGFPKSIGQDFRIDVSPDVAENLIRISKNDSLGARPLKRAITRYITDTIIQQDVRKLDCVGIDINKSEFTFNWWYKN